jgi:hypothetical protein
MGNRVKAEKGLHLAQGPVSHWWVHVTLGVLASNKGMSMV